MTRSSGLEVYRATIDDRPVLENLLELYLYEFSEIADFDVDSTGRFGYADLPNYWAIEGRYPYLATVDRKWTGFALVQLGSVITAKADVWDMQQFFVMRKYRHRGVGSELARRVWRKHPGQWEVRILENNPSALKFWANVVKQEFPTQAEPVIASANDKTYNVFQFEVQS